MSALETWAEAAARELRAVVEDAEMASPGESVCVELRALLAEYDDIKAGRPTWKSRLQAEAGRDELAAFLRED